MKHFIIPEPELEFGGAQSHIDIRFGLRDFGPLDVGTPTAPENIKVGIVGSRETVEGFEQWLVGCRGGIAARPSQKPHLFPAFPGNEGKTAFHCEMVVDQSLERLITRNDLLKFALPPTVEERIKQAVQRFDEEIQHLADSAKPDVIVCAFPDELIEILDDPNRSTRWNFHDALKAKAMAHRIPLQLVLPSLYDATKIKKQKKSGLARTMQDEATRAWNIHSALYYKAGGTAWRLRRESSALDTCYVGMSFFRTLDQTALSTSIAQVFNERGEGVVVRGATAQISKQDKQPHLTEPDAFDLIVGALQRYRQEHKNLPARIVVHKSSSYSEDELSGIRQALAEAEVEVYDLLHIRPSNIRLYRGGQYPVLRGTGLQLEEGDFTLYTRGSVPFFETYPGQYVPRPLRATVAISESTTMMLASELLALSKLNWNTTQFDGWDPITVLASSEVGKILRFCDQTQAIAPRYSFYM